MALIDKIPTSKRDTFLKMILKAYVDQQGLGALPKPDLDSLIIYAFLQNTNDSYSNFDLSQLFKIKESRIKSLRELGAVKYEHLGIIDEKIIWVKVFKQILNSMLEVESYDKSQLRFHLDDPAIYRYLQKEVISFGGHVNYNKSSEQVIISYSSFSKLIVLFSPYENILSNSNDIGCHVVCLTESNIGNFELSPHDDDHLLSRHRHQKAHHRHHRHPER